MPYVPLAGALAILLVLDARHEERFDAAAVRWAGRLATEAPGLELAELAGALQARYRRSSRCPTSMPSPSLPALAGRARRPEGAPAAPANPRPSQRPGPRWLA